MNININIDTETKQNRRFTKSLLNEVIQRDSATLIGEYNNINVNTTVIFLCSCGNEYRKKFKQIVDRSGTFCKLCTEKNKQAKQIQTCIQRYNVKSSFLSPECKEKSRLSNLNRYGVENPFQSDVIKQKIKETNKEKYGADNPFQSELIKQKIKNTNIQKYGVENPAQSEDIKQKIFQTNIQKFGFKCSLQSSEIQDKSRKTNLDRWGVECTLQSPIVKEKVQSSLLKKYGVKSPIQCLEIKQKMYQTNIERYGVENAQQSSEIQNKTQMNAKKYKEYNMPSGQIRKVQGYEPFALDALLKTYTEDQIKTERKDVGRIEYEVNGNKKYYFPDIGIPHENKLIEVKSTWTYKLHTELIKAKAEATRAKGYTYEMWIFDAKGQRVSEESLQLPPI